jgi:predicted GH43/DUF377 family glycosyl hydrolase
MEKNWTFFEYEGELHAIYSIRPHRVLKIQGTEAVEHSLTPGCPPWVGGHWRGGAAPCKIGEEYWCFCHGKIDSNPFVYSIGLYCFEARPPFRVTRYTPEPLFWADGKDIPPELNWARVVFCNGAILENGIWKCSAGIHDCHSDIFEFSHEEVERLLVRV